MGSDAEGILAATLSEEVMASVLDNKPDACVPGKVDGELNVLRLRGINDVSRETSAGTVVAVKDDRWCASHALSDRRHDLDRIVHVRVRLSPCCGVGCTLLGIVSWVGWVANCSERRRP